MPSNPAVWISLYFGTGLTLGLALYALERIRDGRPFTNSLADPDESPLIKIGVLLVVLVLWPLLIIEGILNSVKAAEFWNQLIDRSEFLSTKRTIKSFMSKGAHIHETSTVEAAEQTEMPTDPLNRTPDVPFGHLNPGWNAFLLRHKDGYKLWAFVIQGQPPDSQADSVAEPSAYRGRQLGYAWVSRQGIEAEFLYEWNQHSDEGILMLSPRVLFIVSMSCLVLFSYDGAQIVMILWICTGGLLCIAAREVRRKLRTVAAMDKRKARIQASN